MLSVVSLECLFRIEKEEGSVLGEKQGNRGRAPTVILPLNTLVGNEFSPEQRW